jgi:Holliday junction resolvase RusA-like endonuclease
MTVPATTRGDIDNWLKAINDFLERHGVVENDRPCLDSWSSAVM